MNEQETTVFVASSVLIVALSVVLALWLATRLRRTSDQLLAPHATGVIAIPVRRLRRRFGFFGHSQNAINPRLEIAPHGLRFQVFNRDQWAFADIVQVDAVRALFLFRLEIRSRIHGRLYIDLADSAHARNLLRSLPPSVPLARERLPCAIVMDECAVPNLLAVRA